MSESRLLKKLPLELFERITDFVPREDLRKLRLVSKETRHKTKYAFVKRFFENLSILPSDELSLRRAHEVLKTELCDSVRKITCFLDEIQFEALMRAHFWGERYRDKSLSARPLYALTTIFCILRRLGNLERISITDLESYDPNVTASPLLGWAPQSVRPFVKNADNSSKGHYFWDVVEAMQLSGLRAETFTMDTLGWAIEVRSTTLRHLTMLAEALSETRELTLQTSIYQKESHYDPEFPPSNETELCEMLSNLPVLEHLTIKHTALRDERRYRSFSRPLDKKCIFQALQQQTFPCLRRLEMRNCEVDQEGFESFVERNPTLRLIAWEREPIGEEEQDGDVKEEIFSTSHDGVVKVVVRIKE